MAVQVYVNGIERTSLILQDTFQLEENLTDEVDIFTFSVLKYGSRTFIPAVTDTVTVYNNSTLIWGGTIIDVDQNLVSVGNVEYRVTCKDYSHIMDRRLVVERFTNIPLINIISEILNRYINKIDRIEIANFEANEIWTWGTADTSHFMTGEQGLKFSSSNGIATVTTRYVNLDLATGYTTSDYIEFDVFVENVANLDTLILDMGTSTFSDYYRKTLTASDLVEGWNYVRILKSAFSAAGSPSWASIAAVQFTLTATVPAGIKVWSNDAGTTTNRLIWDGGVDHVWQADSSSLVYVTLDNLQLLRSTAFRRYDITVPSQIVKSMVFNYEYPSACFKRLAELFGWEWYVDENKFIHFFAKFDKAAPFNLTDTNGTYVYRSLQINNNYDQLRNSIYVRGGDYQGDAINDDLSHQADNTNKIFKLGWRYKDYSLYINTLHKAVGVDGLDHYHDNVGIEQTATGATNQAMGDAAARTKVSQQVIVSAHGRRSSIKLHLKKTGTPSDNVQVQIYNDDGTNQPGSTLLSGTAIYAGSSLTTSYQEIEFELTEATVSSLVFDPGSKYHIVVSRSGANDGSNYYQLDTGNLGKFDDTDGYSYIYNTSWTRTNYVLTFAELLDFDVLYSFQEKILTFESAPVTTDSIIFTGEPIKPVLVLIKDNSSITEFGEFQVRVIDKSILSIDAAKQRANQEILAWADTVSEGSFLTFSDGLHTGQTINIQSTDRSLNEDYIIKKVTATLHTPTTLAYQVELVTTKTMGILYWLQAQLLRQSTEIEIADDEVLEKVEAINETVTLTTSYVTLLSNPKVWSNDAGTTTDHLTWDGGAGHIWG